MKKRLLLVLLLMSIVSTVSYGEKKKPKVPSKIGRLKFNVLLRSKDGKELEISKNIARTSSLLRDMIEEMEDEEEKIIIPVPVIEAKYLKIMLDLMAIEYRLKKSKKDSSFIDNELYEKLLDIRKNIKKRKEKFSYKSIFRAATYLGCSSIERAIISVLMDFYTDSLIGEKPRNVLKLSDDEMRDVFGPLVSKYVKPIKDSIENNKFDVLFEKSSDKKRKILLKILNYKAIQFVKNKESFKELMLVFGDDSLFSLAIRYQYWRLHKKNLKGEYLKIIFKDKKLTMKALRDYPVTSFCRLINKMLYFLSVIHKKDILSLYFESEAVLPGLGGMVDFGEPCLFPTNIFLPFYSKLKNLTLINMDIKRLPEKIKKFVYLEKLVLDGSPLKDFNVIGELKNLKILSLNFMTIKELPKSFLNLKNLKTISVKPAGSMFGFRNLDKKVLEFLDEMKNKNEN